MRSCALVSLFHWLSLIFAGVILSLGVIYGAVFEIVCSVCIALFWLAQQQLFSALKKELRKQKNACKKTSFFLLVPTAGIIALGIYIIFYSHMHVNIPTYFAYGICILSIIMVAGLILALIFTRKDNALVARFSRQITIAAFSAPLSLLIANSLYISQTESANSLVSLSVTFFGGMALLIVLNMALTALCNFKGTIDSIKSINRFVNSKKLIITGASVVKDGFLVIGKLAISIFTTSFFMFVNSLYSAGMGAARFVAIKMHSQDRAKQIQSYRFVGIIVLVSSICYILYSVRLFFGGKSSNYSMYIAITIAMYTFVEFGINIKEAFKLRQSKSLEAKALRAISFSSTLLCFVLTQTAIMSFATAENSSNTNALSGIFFGSLAALIGVYVVIDSLHQKTAVPSDAENLHVSISSTKLNN